MYIFDWKGAHGPQILTLRTALGPRAAVCRPVEYNLKNAILEFLARTFLYHDSYQKNTLCKI